MPESVAVTTLPSGRRRPAGKDVLAVLERRITEETAALVQNNGSPQIEGRLLTLLELRDRFAALEVRA